MAIGNRDDYEGVYEQFEQYPGVDLDVMENLFAQVPLPEDEPDPPNTPTAADHLLVFNVMKTNPDFYKAITEYQYTDMGTGITYEGEIALAVQLDLWKSQVHQIVQGVRAMYQKYIELKG